jgi:hypothetical protein
MTLPDLGPDRTRHASDTRQLAERERSRTAPSTAHVSPRAFWIGFAVILIAIVGFAVVLRLT